MEGADKITLKWNALKADILSPEAVDRTLLIKPVKVKHWSASPCTYTLLHQPMFDSNKYGNQKECILCLEISLKYMYKHTSVSHAVKWKD